MSVHLSSQSGCGAEFTLAVGSDAIRLMEGGGEIAVSPTVGSAFDEAAALAEVVGRYPAVRPPREAVERLSARLGRIAFPEKVRAALAPVVQASEAVRLRLHLGDPTWERLPWEAASLGERQDRSILFGPVSLHPRLRFCRGVIAGRTAPPECRHARPRILIAWADPQSERSGALPFLREEVAAILAGVGKRADVRTLEETTPGALKRRIAAFEPDLLHFLGHGGAGLAGPSLILHGASAGTEVRLDADELAGWLLRGGVRICYLSACESAGDGLAERLAGCGIPVAVGMQTPIADEHRGAAVRAFYRALAEGATVDDALRESRSLQRDLVFEWAVPVLATSCAPLALVASDPSAEETDIVGRSDLLRRCQEFLRGPEPGAIVLTGPGGIGKTRVAEALMERHRADYPDGAHFLACDHLATNSELAAAIALRLGLPTDAADSLPALMARLERTEALLVLDGVDVLAAEGGLHEFLHAARSAGVRLVVTSRIAPRVRDGLIVEVGPLPMSGDETRLSPGGRLLLSAAQRVGRLVAPDDPNVEEIVRLLEGVPLAILLAAARLGVCTLSELLDDVRSSRTNSVGDRLGAGRHANLHRVVRDSLRLLSEPDRRLLWRLSVFHGSFARQDALAVLEGDRFELMDGLARLNAHSLLQVRDEAGRSRYRMLDTIREYCASITQNEEMAAERQATLHSHARHCAAIAEEITRFVGAGEWAQANESLWHHLGDLRAAVAFSAREGLDSLVLTFANVLARPLFEAGLWSDFERLAGYAKGAIRRTGRLDSQAALLGLEGALAARRGDWPATEAAWTARLALGRALGDRAVEADALIDLGCEAFTRGDLERAESDLTAGLAVAEAAGRAALQATACVMLAKCRLAHGDRVGASDLLRQARAISAADDPEAMLMVTINFGIIGARLGEEGAQANVVEALCRAAAAQRWFHVAWALRVLAESMEADRPSLSYRAYASAAGLYRLLRSARSDDCRSRCTALAPMLPVPPTPEEGVSAALRDPIRYVGEVLPLFLPDNFAR
jgi:predicted ATPase